MLAVALLLALFIPKLRTTVEAAADTPVPVAARPESGR
jgi:hypothetical protein